MRTRNYGLSKNHGVRTACVYVIPKYVIQCYILSDDAMIYTYVNMYIAFVTSFRDVRDRDQV